MSEILRINLTKNTINREESPKAYFNIGGRSLISAILQNEVEPTCDPLGPNNKLIVAPGLLAGTTVSCVNRISIGGKSPLTGTIKESNGGGTTALKLARLGIKAVIFEGQPAEKYLSVVYISNDKTEIIPFNELKDRGVNNTADILKERFGRNNAMAIIGPAGERLYRSSGIANLDSDGTPSRYCARGGLGALMGSKKIKAIVIDDNSSSQVEIKDMKKFKEIKRKISHKILKNERLKNTMTKLGTAGSISLIESMGGLPTRNFSTGNFEGVEKINGESLYSLIISRNGEGKPSHSCMPGCLIKCSNVIPDKNGKMVVSPLEYESIVLLGSNCGIDDLDVIANLNRICNDIGVDTIEVGATIGVVMEAGIIDFGDGEGAIHLLEEMKRGSDLGRIIGAGAEICGKVLGVRRIPICKGQAIPAYEPRALKGFGVTYATSPMGADHTAGPCFQANVDHQNPDGQIEASRNSQIVNTIHDYLGTCYFIGIALEGELELLIELLSAMKGKSYSLDNLKELANRSLKREKVFNEKAGFNMYCNKLPEFFYTEKNLATNTVFDVAAKDLWAMYY